jgi:hypothetical protein
MVWLWRWFRSCLGLSWLKGMQHQEVVLRGLGAAGAAARCMPAGGLPVHIKGVVCGQSTATRLHIHTTH